MGVDRSHATALISSSGGQRIDYEAARMVGKLSGSRFQDGSLVALFCHVIGMPPISWVARCSTWSVGRAETCGLEW